MSDDLILRAARLAAVAHQGQNRKWDHNAEPYILHPMRVAGFVALHFASTPEMVAASWLHDAVEDARNPEAMRGMILKDTGAVVLGYVDELTNASKQDPEIMRKPRAERKAADRAKLATASWESRFIKLVDRFNNLLDLDDSRDVSLVFVKTYKDESRLLLEVLKGTDAEYEARVARAIGG